MTSFVSVGGPGARTQQLDGITVDHAARTSTTTDDLAQLSWMSTPVIIRPSQRAYTVVKRLLDILGATLALVLLSPLMIGLAVAIAIDSSGPILFSQPRAGSRRRRVNGVDVWAPRVFTVLKFRTMVADAEASTHEDHIAAYVQGRLEQAANGAAFKLTSDPRITRVGRFLRRTSLDELPQLINVLRGTMSLVGPRPIPCYEAEQYPSRERMATTPGITGLWQVSGRCDLPFSEMERLDHTYLETQSVRTDLRILVRTIPAVITGRGAG